MPEYRMYLIPHDRRRQPGLVMDCGDDGEAVDLAHELAECGHLVEVWQGARLVGEVRVG